jgi:hypothetical protein
LQEVPEELAALLPYPELGQLLAVTASAALLVLGRPKEARAGWEVLQRLRLASSGAASGLQVRPNQLAPPPRPSESRGSHVCLWTPSSHHQGGEGGGRNQLLALC